MEVGEKMAYSKTTIVANAGESLDTIRQCHARGENSKQKYEGIKWKLSSLYHSELNSLYYCHSIMRA
jgi:hypothetical protein